MHSLSNAPRRPWLLLGISVLVCAGVWHWATAVLVPVNLAAYPPRGNNSDLYARWLGTRELLLHGRDPYSAQLTREAQLGFYGRQLDPANPSDPKAQESFVYPLYIIFLLAPTVTLPFALVATIFRWLLLIAIAASMPLWMYAVRMRTRWPVIVAAMFLAVGSNPAIAEYSQQNLTALALLFLAAGVAAVARNRMVWAGVLLALATIKPDITIAMVLWLLAWAAWRPERRRVLWAFLASLTLLVSGAQALSPGWMGRFFAAVREYPSYGTDPSILQVLLPPLIARLAVAILAALVCTACWRWRSAAPESDRFGWTVALVAAVTVVCIPKLAAYNQLLLIPALLALLRNFGRASNLWSRALTKAALACQLWQWIAALTLSILSLWFAPWRLFGVAHLPLYTWLALSPLTLLALLATIAAAGAASR